MSGFVGIIHFDGRPVDAELLRGMTAALRHRGPDGEATWIEGAAGFGYTRQAATADAQCDRQPLTLDGDAWIVADARLDARRDLVDRLRASGRTGVEAAGDAALLLHAYLAWGDRCVDRLRGDFAFAIWSRGARRFFAARDHFGVKPLYFGRVAGGLVFGNTLECVRMHPQLSDRLDEMALADFLLFGLAQDPSSTVFADVRKVEPASTLGGSADEPLVAARRYWELPASGRIRFREPQEYVDRFSELLQAAVSDRLGAGGTGIWMSGGIDSAAIAVAARRGIPAGTHRLTAHTIVYDSLIPDDERTYARQTAQALDLPIEFIAADRYEPLAGWERPDLQPPEPIDEPFLLLRHDVLQMAASTSRVWFSGDAGDELLRQSYLIDLIGRMPLADIGAGLVQTMRRPGRRPGLGVRARVRRLLGADESPTELPTWLDRDFARRLDLRARWRRVLFTEPSGDHELRPEAQSRLACGQWSASFEAYDFGATRIAVEYRTPFLDLRVVEYLLSIPPLPWCVDKHLVRSALEGRIPDSVRLRRKSPLAAEPLEAHVRRAPIRAGSVDPAEELRHYVDIDALRRQLRDSRDDLPLHLRPLYVGHWLRHRR